MQNCEYWYSNSYVKSEIVGQVRKKHINLNTPVIFNIQISLENFVALREDMGGTGYAGGKG